MRRALIAVAGVAVIGLALLFVPQFDYAQRGFETGSQPIRVHRLTGRTEALYRDGWRVIQPKPTPQPLTPAQEKARAETEHAWARAEAAQRAADFRRMCPGGFTDRPPCQCPGRIVATNNGPNCIF